MGTITINGKKYEFTNEKNVLTIIRNAGIEVPTLCYQPELSVFGACRLCTVEDDRGRCFASCSESSNSVPVPCIIGLLCVKQLLCPAVLQEMDDGSATTQFRIPAFLC